MRLQMQINYGLLKACEPRSRARQNQIDLALFPPTSTTPLAVALLAPAAPQAHRGSAQFERPPQRQAPHHSIPPTWPFTPMSSDSPAPLAVISPAAAGRRSPASPNNTKPLRPGSRRCTGRLPGLAGGLA
jgi:hypothetical protein